MRLATLRGPAVLIAATRAEAAHDVGPASFSTPNPRLTVTTERGAPPMAVFYAFLPFFGRRQAAAATTEALAGVADTDVEIARLDARLAASLAWIDLWLAQHEVDIARQSLARRQRLVEIAAERMNAGSGSRLDGLRARTEAIRQQGEVEALEAQRRAAAARLAFLLGLDPASAAVRAAGEPTSFEAPAIATLEESLAAHPVYVRGLASVHADSVAVHTQRRQLWPYLGLEGGMSLGAPNGGQGSVMGAVLLEVPVYNVPLLRRARATQRATAFEAEATGTRLYADMIAARAELEAAVIRAHTARDEILPAAREVADLATDAYREGSLDLTAVVTSEQAYLDAELASGVAAAGRARATAHLQHAMGTPL